MDVIPVQLVKQSADKLKNQMEKDEQSLYAFFLVNFIYVVFFFV